MQTFVRPSVGPQAQTLAQKWYVSDEVFREERERLFSRSWVCVGHESRVAAPGDYVLVDVTGESLMLVRDGAGVVHALFNVCRHRGTRLCESAAGHFVGSIQCPYHAWTYALDGALLAARNMEDVAGFARADYPLRRARVRIVGGFIFVLLDERIADAEPPLAALAPHLKRWDTARLTEVRRITYDLACNWKLVFQNYSECYHCPVVHPQLDKLSPSDSGRNDFTTGPVLGGYSELRPSVDSLTTRGARGRPLLGSVGGEDERRSYYYTIFPSLMVSLHPDYLMYHTVRPIAANRTEVDCAWLFDPTIADARDFDPSDAIEFWDLTNCQDWHVNELTQVGITSRAYQPGPYANAEGLLHAFDRHYLAAIEPREDARESGVEA